MPSIFLAVYSPNAYSVTLDKLSKPRWEEGYVVLNSSPFLTEGVLSKLKL